MFPRVVLPRGHNETFVKKDFCRCREAVMLGDYDWLNAARLCCSAPRAWHLTVNILATVPLRDSLNMFSWFQRNIPKDLDMKAVATR